MSDRRKRTGCHPSTLLGSFIPAVLAAWSCGTTPTDLDREVRLSIDGADTLSFGTVASQVQLTTTISVSEGDLPPVRWRSTSSGVATISERGLLVSAGDGTTKIIASADQASDTVIVVVNQIPVQLSFSVEPANAAADIPFFFPVTVFITDSNGIAVQRGSEPITLQLGQNPGAASLTGTTTKSAVNGLAIFDGLVLDAPSFGYTLVATTTELSSLSMPFDVLAGPDVVHFRNTGGQPVGAVLDGQSTQFVNDFSTITTDSTVVTVMANAPRGDEIVAFTEGRPPEILTTPLWTTSIDTVTVTFRDTISISVTAWIVAGPFDQLRMRAINQSATTAAVWAAERMGIQFGEFEIIDATGDPDASQLQSTTQCNQRTLAQSAIGTRTNRINVYYVGMVDNGRDRGYSCGDVIFMADRSGHELLVHEIGHSFGLGHINDLPGYDRTNVMHSSSSVREFLTEGQVFRQHFNTGSALNLLYSVQPNGVRQCGPSSLTDRCMELVRRLWIDGTFPPTQ